jgi:hypothetical protein
LNDSAICGYSNPRLSGLKENPKPGIEGALVSQQRGDDVHNVKCG